MIAIDDIRVWQTITLSGLKTSDDYLAALENAKIHVSRWATEAIKLADLLPSCREVDLVELADSDLVHLGGYVDLISATGVKQLGLGYIRVPSVLDLRLQYRTQPRGERLFMAMRPINIRDEPLIFVVENCQNGLSLDVKGGRTFVAKSLWVFNMPK